jgi:hypothetical protein
VLKGVSVLSVEDYLIDFDVKMNDEKYVLHLANSKNDKKLRKNKKIEKYILDDVDLFNTVDSTGKINKE